MFDFSFLRFPPKELQLSEQLRMIYNFGVRGNQLDTKVNYSFKNFAAAWLSHHLATLRLRATKQTDGYSVAGVWSHPLAVWQPIGMLGTKIKQHFYYRLALRHF